MFGFEEFPGKNWLVDLFIKQNQNANKKQQVFMVQESKMSNLVLTEKTNNKYIYIPLYLSL